MPTHVGKVPMDGILGNDVLKHFRVEQLPRLSMTLAGDPAKPVMTSPFRSFRQPTCKGSGSVDNEKR